MEKIAEFKKLLSDKAKSKVPIQVEWGKVVKVDWNAKTADVEIDELIYYDVLLGLGNQYRKPKLNTRCLIGSIENKEASYLIDAEEIEEVVTLTGDAELVQKKEGFSVKKGNESLREVLTDFMDECNKIMVIQGNTIDVAAVTAIKQRLKIILTA